MDFLSTFAAAFAALWLTCGIVSIMSALHEVSSLQFGSYPEEDGLTKFGVILVVTITIVLGPIALSGILKVIYERYPLK